MSDLYNRIQKLAENSNLSVSAMCKEIGISRSALTELKSGRTKSLSSVYLNKISSHFGVTTDFLLGKSEIKVYDENDNIVVLDDETRDFIDQLRKRPEQRLLFSVSKKATKEDIIKAVKIIEALEDNEEGE